MTEQERAQKLYVAREGRVDAIYAELSARPFARPFTREEVYAAVVAMEESQRDAALRGAILRTADSDELAGFGREGSRRLREAMASARAAREASTASPAASLCSAIPPVPSV